MTEGRIEAEFRRVSQHFDKWEVIKDMVDQLIDIMLNYRQSGHPGGSRSKVHALVALMLSGVMRYDLRHPEKRFGDRFILSAGHTIPLVYAMLAVLSDAMRVKFQQTGDPRYYIPPERIVLPEDLLLFRRNRGLPGHAEMAGKTLFLKFNTGPSGHGAPAAAGQALALRIAGVDQVKVVALEGEGGLTPGGVHETMNSAWGLGLHNLYFVIDWNDFGIDDHPISSVVPGTPVDWFGAHGWRVVGCDDGHDWSKLTRMILELFYGPNDRKVPNVGYMRTKKGRGYLKYDNHSHGAPHPINSEIFWETKRPFMEKYGVEFEGFGKPAPADPQELQAQERTNIERVMGVLRRDQELVDYIAETLASLGDSVPEEIGTYRLGDRSPWSDERLYDYRNYPPQLYLPPGKEAANRNALARWAAWVNYFGFKEYGRPLFIAASADLAESTNIAGFAKAWEDFPGFGWYDRDSNTFGALLPQEITEFANAGICVGMATVNFARDPYREFNGFYTACSTYGSFAYLKYGPMRLFSQLAQDCELKVGKVIWVAGHSGPETADDSRTHFGIFSPGVGQLFPKGKVVNVHPWEHNEVPVVLAAALRLDAPIIVLHLTRPPIRIPDREALGIPSHFEAARGAYLIRDYRPGLPRMGTVIVQGTSTTNNLLQILPELDRRGINVKIVAAISYELFMAQPEEYRRRILPEEDWLDSMVITNGALRLMHDWLSSKVAEQYSLSSDWDNRWRTGGTVEELCEEAHISPRWILAGIEKFAREREKRLGYLHTLLDRLR
ncbi:MAG: transketolase [candidate division KSB1 bacterium]|nr:transketolase [candidate division KSB1 bacterium]